MTSETREIIAEALSEDMPLEMLMEQKVKTQDSDMVEVINEELSERHNCPECSNDMMLDEDEKEIYCPLGHHSHSV